MDIKLAVIGCGYWGKNLIRNFSKLGVLTAVCDSDHNLAKNLSEIYQVQAYSLEEILASTAINAVVIAVPAAFHAMLARQCLKAKKHIFVEKPLALTVLEGEESLSLAKEHHKLLMVGHLLRYHPAFVELQHLITKGVVGKLRYLYSTRLNLGKFRTEENILWSFAPHDISMLLALTGTLPEKVQAFGSHYLSPRVADVTTTHLEFAHGVAAHIFVSWLHPYKEQKLVVVGERAMVVFDDGLPWEQKLILYPHQVDWVNQYPIPHKAQGIPVELKPSEPLENECQHFLDCIERQEEPCTDGEEALGVLRVLDAAERSMTSQQAIYLPRQGSEPSYFKHETAIVDEQAVIGLGTKIWHFSHIMAKAHIGAKVTIGQNVLVAPKVMVGAGTKIQNNVSLYTGVILKEDVFCGPSCVFTNVYNPRSEVDRKHEFQQTLVERGVTIGANATILCGLTLGPYCFIGAGAVVTRSVPAHALVVGNPARQIGWMSHAGEKLGQDLVCPKEGRRYCLVQGHLQELKEQTNVTNSFC